MTDISPIHAVLAFTLGMGLGILYFGGLWLTLRKIPAVRRPAGLMAASLCLRMALVLVAFYLIAGDGPEGLVSCLLGFLLARFLSLRAGLKTKAPALR